MPLLAADMLHDPNALPKGLLWAGIAFTLVLAALLAVSMRR